MLQVFGTIPKLQVLSFAHSYFQKPEQHEQGCCSAYYTQQGENGFKFLQKLFEQVIHRWTFDTFKRATDMTKLSVNINKIATIRNARGGNVPDILVAARRIEAFGAHGITVHPRPDERHIRYRDVYDLKKVVTTEFNVEGYPSEDFLNMVIEVKPHQVTLVPDAPDAITSNAGWDAMKHKDYLSGVISRLKNEGIRTSIFLDPNPDMVAHAKETGTDRIELYTEAYATGFFSNRNQAIASYVSTAEKAHQLGLGINAGHDLSLDNLKFFVQQIPQCLEVSIGHALISDALYLGLENTVQLYLRELEA
jgi:pyridoxine 5-phosphate synthase